ncbi:hypothetical protein O181_085506 [Austropuccinia psidii MF-1]|uniref:Integrase catalytic domain-containing protein n=1 Tax=Austropuccinia psidii MF-1 TaxID=1389203 RepID=A0A9Q3FT16_9BASI|nr:hypothetical protein [Austropuccinia psidii MF-1]
MIKIQESCRPVEIVHMDWGTGPPPGVDRSYNACLMIFDRFCKTPISLPCHKDDKAMDTACLIWNRVLSWTGIFTNIISDRDLRFTSALWTNLHKLFGKNLSFSRAYNQQTDGLAERMIQTLDHMVRSTSIGYRTYIHASTNQTPAILELEWNPKLTQDSLTKDLVELHPTAASFEGMVDKARKHGVRCMGDSFSYAKGKWEKSRATTDFKVEDLVLASTNNFNNIKGCQKVKNSFARPFFIKALHGENAVEVELSEELSNKHPTF